MTKWLDQLNVWVRALWHDVLDEERAPAAQRGDLAEVNGILDTLRARLATLRAEHLAAATRERQALLEWQAAVNDANGVSLQVDDALRAGQEPLARTALEKLNRLQTRATALAERHQANTEITRQLHQAVTTLQAREADARRRLVQLAEQQQRAQVLEQLQTLRRTLQRDTEALQAALEHETERVARLEDRLAARAELDRTR